MAQSNQNQAKAKVVLRPVSDSTLAAMIGECMEACEWDKVIPENGRVLIKPNLCTAVPEKWEMSNTDPRITEEVCKIILRKTKNVAIVESSGLRQTAWEAFEVSGYRDVARRLGVELINLTESKWVKVDVPPAGKVDLPEMLLTCDAFVTLPVLKTHALTYFTGAIKNQWGCVPQYDRILLHKHLDQMLASLHAIFKPRLVVMDGIIGMEGRGPANGKPRRLDLILASQDSVAIDSTAMRLVGLEPDLCKHVILSSGMGLGVHKAEQIEVDGDWQRHVTQFEPAILDKAIAAMDYMSRYRWFVKYMLEKDYVFYPIRACVQVLRKVGLVEGGG